MFDPFLVPKQPIVKAFCDSGVAKMACNGRKKGSFHLFVQPKWCRIIFGKTPFHPFFTHFLSIFKVFCDCGVPKLACNGLKMGSFHLFRHPKRSRIIYGKTHF